MSNRAEQAALKAYPNTTLVHHYHREGFVDGYNQAEKDLALTWKDIKEIDVIMHDVATEHTYGAIRPSTFKEYYEEVLLRFNGMRNDTEQRN